MTRRRNLAIIAASVILAACATPTVDTSAPTFNEKKYTVDLDNCRGGTVLDVALHGLGAAVIGSAYSAYHGAYIGALSGNSPEGAAIGAVVGGVIGVVVGAYEPVREQEQSVQRCLSKKGYVLAS
jgi:outer membrane lipoprotein SlyB